MNKNEHNHIMVDLETMGNKSYSSIISIGAVKFDMLTGDTSDELYINVDLQSCLDVGLTVDASTIMWWMQQNDQARKDLVNGHKVHIKDALSDFAKFCGSPDYQLWGNSPRFDLGILQNAYNKLNIPIPWDFRKERCVRTLVSLKPEIKEHFEFKGTAHNPISDCHHQIKYCSAIWRTVMMSYNPEFTY